LRQRIYSDPRKRDRERERERRVFKNVDTVVEIVNDFPGDTQRQLKEKFTYFVEYSLTIVDGIDTDPDGRAV